MIRSSMLSRVKLDRFQEIALGAQVRQELYRQLSSIPVPAERDCERFIRESFRAVANGLPEQVLDALDTMKHDPYPPGAVLLKNMPIDSILPTTPQDGRWSSAERVPIAEGLILGVARLVGEPYSYKIEKGGDLVHNVVPVRGKERSLTNMGSLDDLGWHTENAYFAHPPRWLILFCLRPDHEKLAMTPVADGRDAVEKMSPQGIVELRKPHFRVRCPFIFDEIFGPDNLLSAPRPIITGSDDSPEIRVALYGDLTQAQTPVGLHALQALDKALGDVGHRIRLDAGDMLILSNRIALHARSSFPPRFDGNDRWLLRVHVADSFWPLRDWQQESLRVLTN